MNTQRLWILGADDVEMAAIERLLRGVGEVVIYANVGGVRVHPGNAYRYDGGFLVCSDAECRTIYQIECDYDRDRSGPSGLLIQIDHHRFGDPGYGKPPQEYLEASSIGQVIAVLEQLGIIRRMSPTTADTFVEGWHQGDYSPIALWQEVANIAAADHCLEAAYRGKCPGVYSDTLMKWRAASRAAFQKRSVDDVLADIEAARKKLHDAIRIRGFADLRGQQIPELPEAACREGIPFISEIVDRDGRKKVVLQAAPADLIRRFLSGEIIAGLVDYYGDPARGFAGGYERTI